MGENWNGKIFTLDLCTHDRDSQEEASRMSLYVYRHASNIVCQQLVKNRLRANYSRCPTYCRILSSLVRMDVWFFGFILQDNVIQGFLILTKSRKN